MALAKKLLANGSSAAIGLQQELIHAAPQPARLAQRRGPGVHAHGQGMIKRHRGKVGIARAQIEHRLGQRQILVKARLHRPQQAAKGRQLFQVAPEQIIGRH